MFKKGPWGRRSRPPGARSAAAPRRPARICVYTNSRRAARGFWPPKAARPKTPTGDGLPRDARRGFWPKKAVASRGFWPRGFWSKNPSVVSFLKKTPHRGLLTKNPEKGPDVVSFLKKTPHRRGFWPFVAEGHKSGGWGLGSFLPKAKRLPVGVFGQKGPFWAQKVVP